MPFSALCAVDKVRHGSEYGPHVDKEVPLVNWLT